MVLWMAGGRAVLANWYSQESPETRAGGGEPGHGRPGPGLRDAWAADAGGAGLTPVQEVWVAIEDASVLVAGQPAGERLGLAAGSRVLVRRAIRSTAREGGDAPPVADSLADEYYP